VSQLVDENELRPASQDRVEIPLGQNVALVFDPSPWDDLEALKQGFGLAPDVHLDAPTTTSTPSRRLGLSRQQHLVGLA
jgi:hypothetical protein